MEINYLVLLDYCSGRIKAIKLTEGQKEKSSQYEDLEDYIVTLEDEYGFRLSDCCWMSLENYEMEKYGF